MSEVTTLPILNETVIGAEGSQITNVGTLQIEGAAHVVTPYIQTEDATAATSAFLEAANCQKPKESLSHFQFTPLSLSEANLASDISHFQKVLETPELSNQTLATSDKKREALTRETTTPRNRPLENPFKVFQAAFTRTSSNQAIKQENSSNKQSSTNSSNRKEGRNLSFTSPLSLVDTPQTTFDRSDQQRESKDQGKEDQNQQKQKDNQKEGQRNPFYHHKRQAVFTESKKGKIEAVQPASLAAPAHPLLKNAAPPSPPPPVVVHGGVNNIYMRFMALMARILGQAEAEAHSLYLKIKDRTDNIDLLTQFLAKVNAVKGDVDWSLNEEMKQLVERVRALGVEIPQGKYTWTEDEKKLLKENVQLRKDSLEKITQLERTDMQRYLQEASQCHQARSNILKLLKEVMDTIIHNFRPS